MATEALAPKDLPTQVRESLNWVTRDLLGEYGLYIDKQTTENPKLGTFLIDHIYVFNKNVKGTVMSINSKQTKAIISMLVWVREEYLNLNKEQKFLAFVYLGREIVNNDDWSEIGLGHVDNLKEEDVHEVDYFFRNILNPESSFFIAYLKAYEKVFMADKTVRKNMTGIPQVENLINELRKPS